MDSASFIMTVPAETTAVITQLRRSHRTFRQLTEYQIATQLLKDAALRELRTLERPDQWPPAPTAQLFLPDGPAMQFCAATGRLPNEVLDEAARGLAACAQAVLADGLANELRNLRQAVVCAIHQVHRVPQP